MSLQLTSLRTGRRLNWGRVLGLLLVPLTVAGLLLWGLWNPQERLDNVSAAVVNLDEPVEVDGQLVPLGRVLAGELIAGDADENFTWVLTDEEDADEGLSDGRYATVVTIPENFSEAATSLSGDPDEIETATIDIAEGDRGRLIDSALSNIVTQTALQVLNRELGEQFVGGIYVGFNELRGGLSEAADGASQLADGTQQLGEGASELADGTAELADGTQQLASGAQELANGAGELAGGSQALAGGASELAGGASELASGAAGLATGIDVLAYGDGTSQNPGLAGLATGIEGYTSGINGAVTGLQAEAGAAADRLQALYDEIDQDQIPVPPGDKQAVLDRLEEMIAQLRAVQNSDAINQFKDIGTGLAVGTRGAAEGAALLAGGAHDLAGGASELAGGASGLADGAGALAEGTSGLASGASGLATGTSELAAGTPALADGAGQLADGMQQSAEGASGLADGLDEAASGIPETTESDRDRIASTAITAVEAEGANDELFNDSGVPLFAGIALWAGALALFMLVPPLWSRTRDAARGVLLITLRSAAPAAALGAVQGALAGLILPLALGYTFGQGVGFFALATLAGAAFSLVVQGLAALLGGVGRFIAFALLVVGLAVGIVSTAPPALLAVGEASPLGAAYAGFQSIATGAGAAGAAVLLVLWAVGGMILTAFAVRRARKP